jgi:hypothetical protein
MGTAYFWRKLTRVDPMATAVTPWPDTGVVLNQSFMSDTLGPVLIAPAASGVYLLLGAKDGQGTYFRGGFLQSDLMWGPSWSEGTRLVTRLLPAGPHTITSDGSCVIAFPTGGPVAGSAELRLLRLAPDGPVAVAASLAMARVEGDAAELEWVVAEARGVEFAVERGADARSWTRAGLAEMVGSDRVRYRESGLVPGERRAYRLAWREAGEWRTGPPAWVERPAPGGLQVVAAHANARGAAVRIELAGAPGETVRVEVHDVQGRRRVTREGRLGDDGRLGLELGSADWAPGLYLVRARTTGAVAHARVVLSR